MSRYEQLANDCGILFCRKRAFRHDMRCGIACKEGWYSPLRSLFCKIEALNLQYYSKYKVRVVARQVKEKFGTLRVYYDVVIDSHPVRNFVHDIFKDVLMLLRDKVDYKTVTIVDRPCFIKHEVHELTEAEYKEEKEACEQCANVYVEERGGKYFRIANYDSYRDMHPEPTKHKLLWKLKELVSHIANKSMPFNTEVTTEQAVIVESMDAHVNKWVKEAEEQCLNACEECGEQIGTDWSPRCTTKGWVSYVCHKCAEKSKQQYVKNGELWREKTMLMSKEAYAAEMKEACEP